MVNAKRLISPFLPYLWDSMESISLISLYLDILTNLKGLYISSRPDMPLKLFLFFWGLVCFVVTVNFSI